MYVHLLSCAQQSEDLQIVVAINLIRKVHTVMGDGAELFSESKID